MTVSVNTVVAGGSSGTSTGTSDGSTTWETVATTTYTADSTDFASDGSAKTLVFTHASGCLVTIPAGLGLNSGKVMKWLQADNAGQITFQGDGTSTIVSASGDLVSSGELASGYVEHQGSDDFLLVGQIGSGGIPITNKSAAYEFVLADANKELLHPSADTTARTFTIPANSAVAFPVGTVLSVTNQNGAGVVTIAITTDTMRLAGAGTTGSRTLAANGVAVAKKITSTEWIISGTGLS